MTELVTLLIELAFAVIFVVSLWTYLRRRDAASRDVTLVFGSAAGLVVVALVRQIAGSVPVWLSTAVLVLFLALPVLTLRLSARARRIPPAMIWGTVSVYALCAAAAVGAQLVLPAPRPPWVAAVMLGAFGAVEGLAAWFLAAEGLTRSGSARVRLLVAAASTALLAVAVLAQVAGSVTPLLGEVGAIAVRVLALMAAIGYLVAFLPPSWLRRLWRASSAFEFTESLIAADTSSPAPVWAYLVDATARITGAQTVLLVAPPPSAPVTLAALGSLLSVSPAEYGEVAAAARRGAETDSDEWPALASRLSAPRSAILSVTDLGGGEQSAFLAWVSHQHGLFAADDRALIDVIGRRAALFAERAGVTSAQVTLNERLAAVNEALQSASQAKSDFLASMSHELRTPLSAIIGFSSLMRDEPADGDGVTVQREWIEHIHSSGEHLLALINDVLDLSKIEAGRLDLERESVDLPTAISELIGGMRPLASARGIDLSYSAEQVEISADRGRLRQMLYNLVSNAIKFTPPGGRVSLDARRDGPVVKIDVIDTGAGIASDDLERIFLEFHQAGDAAQRQAGTGLGLPLTRRLAEAHGGSVEVRSEVGAGSTFTITLPAGVGPEPVAARAPERPLDSPRVRGREILVIEDDPGTVRLLRTYLEEAGHQVRVAVDGKAGLAAARDSPPGAIILDVLLPDIDGWEVLRELKADPAVRDVPVIVVTVVDERPLGLGLGAVDYFLKPVRREALLARLARYTFTTKVGRRSVRVLAIDDDPTALEHVRAALDPAGFEVVTAQSGAEGLELARSNAFDLVICDLIMPGLDGFEVVSELANDGATRHLPILILTGHDLSEADKRRLNGQILGIVGKGEADLRGALLEWLSRVGVEAQ